MHIPSFSYNISKPYPYRWFTLVTVIGGLVAVTLFSVINLAATGYQSQVVNVAHPNETEYPRRPMWFQKRPWSWAAKVTSSCQAQNFQIGAQFYTDKLAFPYTINRLLKGNSSESVVSFTYRNDFLHDCRMILLNLGPAVNLDTGFAIPLEAGVTCTTYEDNVPMNLELTLAWTVDGFGQMTNSAGGLRVLLNGPNYRTQPSLSWGIILTKYQLTNYLPSVKNLSSSLSFSTAAGMATEGLAIRPGTENSSFVSGGYTINSSSATFITTGWETVDAWTGMSRFDSLTKGIFLYTDTNGNPVTPATNTSDATVQDVEILDSLAKSIYSLVLADLGQSAESNILADPQRTMEFAKGTIQTSMSFAKNGSTDCPWNSVNTFLVDSCDPPNAVADFYNWTNTSIPYVNSSVISTQYLCQIPKLKSMGSVIVNVIVADLVFLQALWYVFTLIISFFIERHDPQANYCAGCVATIPKPTSSDSEMTNLGSTIYKRLPNPVPTLIPPTTASAPPYRASRYSGGASIRLGVSSIMFNSIVRRKNDGTAQSLLDSP